jgi:hypothetical protein
MLQDTLHVLELQKQAEEISPFPKICEKCKAPNMVSIYLNNPLSKTILHKQKEHH